MRPVSDTFLSTVRGSHRMAVEARIVAAGSTGTNPTGTTVAIVGGDVQLDATADVRSTVDLSVDGTGRWPTAASDLLAPYGAEVWVRRGIAYGNGTTEWVSLGYHRIDTVEQDTPPNGPIRISAQDRMAGIIEARLLAPVQYPAATTYGDLLDALVTEVYPSAVIEWDDATDGDAIGRQVIGEEDRYALLNDLVTSVGKVWYWDHRGHLVIATPPDPTDPVFTVNAGAGGVLVALSRRLSRQGVYNAVVATGEAADTETPVRGLAVDDNPLSPTYWSGQFGKVPRFYSSPFITTEAQAQAAARSLLLTSLGLPYAVDLSAIPNPALEPGDAVRVVYPGRDETHVLDQITIPLTASSALTATTREQTLVVIGTEEA